MELVRNLSNLANPCRVAHLATATDVGRVRASNEDSLAFDLDAGVVLLADGMGGCNAGEVASSMAVNIVLRELARFPLRPNSDDNAKRLGYSFDSMRVCTAITRANREIYETSQAHPNYNGMGTTLVLALFRDNRITIANIGDSRLYRIRGDMMFQLTIDHTVLQEQIERGLITPEQAQFSPSRGLITRAVGVDPEVEIDVIEETVADGDVYLLCSDGLFEMVDEDVILETVLASREDLDAAARRLVELANDNGGLDNISLILAETV